MSRRDLSRLRESWDSQRCSSVTRLLLLPPRQNPDHSATTPGAFTARVFDWEVDYRNSSKYLQALCLTSEIL